MQALDDSLTARGYGTVPAPRLKEHPYKQTLPDAERLRRKLHWQQVLKKIRLYYASQQSPFV
jgi:hypothetical protein